ncbi:MAG: type VI secretion system contractile sheath large subunit [Planctomycetota bacterium]
MSANEMQEDGGAVAEGGSLLDAIMEQTSMAPADEGYDVARRGVQTFIANIISSDPGQKIDAKAVDAMISEIDRKMSTQLDQIMHAPAFQEIESSWRSLRYLVDNTDFRENIKIEIMSVRKDELLEDFEDAPEITKSGLYRHLYSAEYGTFGGEPYGAVIGNYDIGPGAQDMALLRNVASVSTMAHAPFIAAAGPKFFSIDSYEQLSDLKDLKSIMEGPQYAKWQSFRESEDARSVALTCPRFLLRLPYGADTVPVKQFNYEESVQGEHGSYLWGNTAFAFAARLHESFAKYRWTPNIIGPQSGGAVTDLPLHQYESMGQIETKVPTEVAITERREYELAEEGFIPLSMRKGSDNACFFSANSTQKPKSFGQSKEGKEAEMNYRLGTQLPYLFIVNRLAHYIKVLQREQIGSWKEKGDLQRELQNWLSQYVADTENPSASIRNTHPLRQASIEVEDVPGEAGWYKVGMKVRPHFKYMGASFTLSLVGKLDKE